MFEISQKNAHEKGRDPEPIRQEIIKLVPFYPQIENLELTDQAAKVDQLANRNIFVFDIEIPKVYFASFENSTNKDSFDILLNMKDYQKGVTIGKDQPLYLFIKPEYLELDLDILEFVQQSKAMNSIQTLSSGFWDGVISYKIGASDIPENISSLAVISQQSNANIILNGEDVSTNQLGYNIVTIDGSTGKLIESKNFNTFVDEKASAELAKFIKDQSKKTIIVGSIRWDASKFLGEDAMKALTSLGLKESVKDKFTYSHGFIAFKGSEDVLEKMNAEAVKLLYLKK